MAEPKDFVTYLNGQMMPHGEAVQELQRGNVESAGGFYDHERTFNGQMFKLRQHLERLYRGLAYAKIDPGISLDEMETITVEIHEANLPLLSPADEFELTQVVSVIPDQSPEEKPVVNVLVYCRPLDVRPFAISYVKGARVVTPSTYGVPSQSPQLGAVHERQRVLPLMTSPEGSITECKGGNFMFVRDGRIKLPDRQHVLPGVSMATVLELANVLDIDVDEGDYSVYDVYMASEVFVSATNYCVLPVETVNGYRSGDQIPGPVTGRILDAWRQMVGVDFVQKALDGLPSRSKDVPPDGGDASQEGAGGPTEQ